MKESVFAIGDADGVKISVGFVELGRNVASIEINWDNVSRLVESLELLLIAKHNLDNGV